MSAIETIGLTKQYPRGVTALDNLSLRIDSGLIFGLLGPNGAGKSTLMKILCTLSRPTSGEARVLGLDPSRHAEEIRRQIGCVFQRSAVDLEATGRENLRLQGRMQGLETRRLNSRIDDLLSRFRLTDAADRIVRKYSGGMQRKLDVALGLVHGPVMLFLDEPTTGLDPEARAELWGEIEMLSSRDRLTVLVTTHYLEEADRLANQIALIDRGRVVAKGTPSQLKSELEGDTITLELRDYPKNDGIQSLLLGVKGIAKVDVQGATVRARAPFGAMAVPAMLTMLEREGVTVNSVQVSRPSLDDVYLRHAGRSIREANSGGVQ
jgi:ABC-2 type transport system ATP-binding protein